MAGQIHGSGKVRHGVISSSNSFFGICRPVCRAICALGFSSGHSGACRLVRRRYARAPELRGIAGVGVEHVQQDDATELSGNVPVG